MLRMLAYMPTTNYCTISTTHLICSEPKLTITELTKTQKTFAAVKQRRFHPFPHALLHSLHVFASSILIYSPIMPANPYVNQLAKIALVSPSKLLNTGILSAMSHATTHSAALTAAHRLHACQLRLCSQLSLLGSGYDRKNVEAEVRRMKIILTVTDALITPAMMMVGVARPQMTFWRRPCTLLMAGLATASPEGVR